MNLARKLSETDIRGDDSAWEHDHRQPRYLGFEDPLRPEVLRPRLSAGLPNQRLHLNRSPIYFQLSVKRDNAGCEGVANWRSAATLHLYKRVVCRSRRRDLLRLPIR